MATVNYKWQLKRRARKVKCPACGEKTFVPFVLSSDNQTLAGSEFGRCERINSCRYFRYPGGVEAWQTIEVPFTPPPPPSFIDPVTLRGEVVNWTTVENSFTRWIVNNYGGRGVEILKMYKIGTHRSGGCVFPQIDLKGRIRTLKSIHYDQATGKRCKDRPLHYLHPQTPDFHLVQCFFGLHLCDGSKPVALVESEKTSIILAILAPEITWVASGGANMLSMQRLRELPRLDMVSPDHGCLSLWKNKIKMANMENKVIFDETPEYQGERGLFPKGCDIADILLNDNNNVNKYKQWIISRIN